MSYNYDETVEGTEQKGRLTSMTDASGGSVYLYNIHGELVKETRTTAGQVFVTEYGYTGNGEVAYMIYPSGRKIIWNRNDSGQLDSVQSLYQGKTGLLAENISSKPFGPVTGLKMGNDLTLSRSFDSLYRLSGITAGGLYERTYTYWSDGLVQDIVDPIGTDHAYSYDDLGQLDTASLPAGAFDFDHDGTGNRLSRTVDSSDVTGYSYVTGTNRLNQSTGAVAAAYGYDASGNIATDSTETTVYDLTDDQRLALVTKGGVTAGAYQYDGRGLRTVKTVNGEGTLFVSCKSGKLIAEADSDGNITKEYVYLEGDIFAHFQYEVPVAPLEATVAVSEPSTKEAPEPVLADNPPAVAATSTPSDTAFLQPIYFLLLLQNKSAEGAYYYVTDHLGAPQIITDDSGSVVWEAEYLPFGDVNISVADIENNLRFPGQYYDAETGLHYNWNRYYDPETGRYIAADPIGLDGGLNLYSYVDQNPINFIDPKGLCLEDACVGETILVTGIIYYGAKAVKETWDALKDRTGKCEEGPCSGYPSRSVAFSQASNE
ncbi:MAG: RHS repeat-associated core domain-containing protein [Candidatus Electrothrix sp. Rat3]|nr:RHS repeat-associated core domain-containing protein [Candidatus Electrothrix rattekaaiensis]